MNSKCFGLVAALCGLFLHAQFGTAQSTAFDYQGSLSVSGLPGNGNYDLKFVLLDAVTGGNQVGPTINSNNIPVSSGGFTVSLDFGANAFIGAPRWLEIGVRPGGTSGAFTTLIPRQLVPTMANAVFATSAGTVPNNAVTTPKILDGAITAAKLTNGAAVKTLNGLTDAVSLVAGANITLTPSANTLTIAASGSGNGWSLLGNSGTTPGLNFFGTTDNQPVEFKVNGDRALRLEFALDANRPASGPNVIGGFWGNYVTPGVYGATIAGGGFLDFGVRGYSNVISGSYSTIGGGANNRIDTHAASIAGGTNHKISSNAPGAGIAGGDSSTIGTGSVGATIGGGDSQTIDTDAADSTIGGGSHNSIGATSDNSTIAGGKNNRIGVHSYRTVIGGGENNLTGDEVAQSVIGGGLNNQLLFAADWAVIAGGDGNLAGPSVMNPTISGGSLNSISNSANFAVIGGGRENHIDSLGESSTISGGLRNTISSNAWHSVIAGGGGNTILADVHESVISGGVFNTIQTGAYMSLIAGGYLNSIQDGSYLAVIGGGGANTILPNSPHATIPGGTGNVVGGAFGFAAGYQAQAQHRGSFVWGDSTDAVFASTGQDQFLIRASGGVGINKNNPSTALDVVGTVRATSFQGDGSTLTGVAPATGSSAYLSKSGDTMSGTLTLPANGLVAGGNQLVLAGGNIGIGTSNPGGHALNVQRDVGVAAGINNNGARIDNVTFGYVADGTQRTAGLMATGEGLPFTLGNFGAAGGFYQGLTMSFGNVGIGTTTPQATLDVAGTTRTCVLSITGGCDLAEPFQFATPDVPKGSVVIIDEENPGKLKLSDNAYDRHVAGIISGANGIQPGITLSQKGVAESGQNVALTGRVYALADAANGPIKPGDLLTTSPVPGHAMKVTDHARAQGAILGKAMTPLGEGRGMVLVLVTLQ